MYRTVINIQNDFPRNSLPKKGTIAFRVGIFNVFSFDTDEIALDVHQVIIINFICNKCHIDAKHTFLIFKVF